MSVEVKGIILVILGTSLFAIQDSLIKLIINQVSLTLILFVRASLGSFLIICFLYFTGRSLNVGSFYPKIAFLRTITYFVGFTCFYLSLSKIPLAEANSLFFLSPIIITILSIFFLGTPIGFHRIITVVIGFFGSLLIIKPSYSDFNWYMFLPIITALTYSIGMLLAKLTSDKDSPFQQSFHIYIGSMIYSSFITILAIKGLPNFQNEQLKFLYNPWVIDNIKNLIAILIIAFTGTLGIFCLIFAYNIGSPQSNAPFEYLLLFYSLIAGFFVFGEVPDLLSFTGMIAIFLSGIYIIYRERRKGKSAISVQSNNK